jgi:2-polyprenyl-3-methyl-5-hydroxy-6-metoxy-1,4-benzoquinol methylase
MPKRWVAQALSTISRRELSRIEQMQESLESLPRLQQFLKYSCDTKKLRTDIRPRFIELSANLNTLDFLRANPPHSSFQGWMRSVMGIFMSNTNANTFLGMYKMHVLDTSNLRTLLGIPLGNTLNSLLDVGAGDGNVTLQLLPLFDRVLAVEASKWCIYRLKEKGIDCAQSSDLSAFSTSEYDVVSCLNVLDRCSRPVSLLHEIRRLMKPTTGRALLAVVLPFQPYVEAGVLARTKRPSEPIGLLPSMGWEESVNILISDVLEPAGLEVERLARVPYLCQGDQDTPYYTLDDAFFVLRAKEPPGARGT